MSVVVFPGNPAVQENFTKPPALPAVEHSIKTFRRSAIKPYDVRELRVISAPSAKLATHAVPKTNTSIVTSPIGPLLWRVLPGESELMRRIDE